MIVVAQFEHYFIILLELESWLQDWEVLLDYLALGLLPPAYDLKLGFFLISIDIKSVNFDVISSQILIFIQFNGLLAFEILDFDSLLPNSFTCTALSTATTSSSCGLV